VWSVGARSVTDQKPALGRLDTAAAAEQHHQGQRFTLRPELPFSMPEDLAICQPVDQLIAVSCLHRISNLEYLVRARFALTILKLCTQAKRLPSRRQQHREVLGRSPLRHVSSLRRVQ
jgi:hypothetical protein